MTGTWWECGFCGSEYMFGVRTEGDGCRWCTGPWRRVVRWMARHA